MPEPRRCRILGAGTDVIAGWFRCRGCCVVLDCLEEGADVNRVDPRQAPQQEPSEVVGLRVGVLLHSL